MTESLRDRMAAARSSTDPELLVNLGCDLSNAGEHIDAAWCFRTVVDLGDESANFNLGNELVALGRDLDAVTAYERALVAGETDAWLNLGDVLERLGDLGGALNAYAQGQAAGDVNAGLARAFLLRATSQGALAEAIIEQLAAAGSAQADAIDACWSYDRTKDPGLESRLRAGRDLHPGARADLADILRHSGRIAQAAKVLQVGVDQGEAEAYLPLGNIYADELNDPAAAEATYLAGITAGDSHCHHNLARLLEDQGRLGEARHHYALGEALGDALARNALTQLDDDDDDDDDDE